MEAATFDHQWDTFSNVRCTHEYETEIEGEKKTLQGRFSGWARTGDEADRATFIHWLIMLDGLGISHPWNYRG